MIVIGVPTRDGGRVFVTAFVAIQNAARAAGVQCRISFEEFGCATLARNWFADATLQWGASHLLFVDDDTIIPRDTIPKLLALDCEIATGITPIAGDPPHTNVQTVKDKFEPCWPEGVFDLEAAGTSCMLIRRDVFERLPFPWFTYYQQRGRKSAMSEDIPFCGAARAAGMRIRCDASVICGHMKHIDIRRMCPQWEPVLV